MTAAMIRQAFAHTPPLWWPVLVLSILALHGEMARAAAAGFTHGQIRLLPHGRLVLDLVPPVPVLAEAPRPTPERLALCRALSGDTAARPAGLVTGHAHGHGDLMVSPGLNLQAVRSALTAPAPVPDTS